MTVRIYHNTDAGAPQLTGAAGSYIAILDAVLVNGYGSKPGLGWTKEFTGTNIAVYRNNTSIPESTGMYLRIDDSNVNHATVRCYKTMSDINTGTDVIPNPNYESQSNIIWFKHYSGVPGTPRQWYVIGDERTVYGFNCTSTNSTPLTLYSHMWGFGDYISYVPSNQWNYMLFGMGILSPTDFNRFPANGNVGGRTLVLGRSVDLIEEKFTPANIACTQLSQIGMTLPGGSNSQSFTAFTGLVFMAPALISELRTVWSIVGQFRGCLYHVGRASDNTFENFGKAPNNPTGPDYRQLIGMTTAMVGSLLVAESDWDG